MEVSNSLPLVFDGPSEPSQEFPEAPVLVDTKTQTVFEEFSLSLDKECRESNFFNRNITFRLLSVSQYLLFPEVVNIILNLLGIPDKEHTLVTYFTPFLQALAPMAGQGVPGGAEEYVRNGIARLNNVDAQFQDIGGAANHPLLGRILRERPYSRLKSFLDYLPNAAIIVNAVAVRLFLGREKAREGVRHLYKLHHNLYDFTLMRDNQFVGFFNPNFNFFRRPWSVRKAEASPIAFRIAECFEEIGRNYSSSCSFTQKHIYSRLSFSASIVAGYVTSSVDAFLYGFPGIFGIFPCFGAVSFFNHCMEKSLQAEKKANDHFCRNLALLVDPWLFEEGSDEIAKPTDIIHGQVSDLEILLGKFVKA